MKESGSLENDANTILLIYRPSDDRGRPTGEDEIGAPPIVLISENFWHRKLSGSPDVIGKTLNLDGKAYTMVGVTPANFELFQRVTIARDDGNVVELGSGVSAGDRLALNVSSQILDGERVQANLLDPAAPRIQVSTARR